MTHTPHRATLLSIARTQALPGRAEDGDIEALVEALGGAEDEGDAFLAEGLTSEDNDPFVSRFLGELLLRPPIPAGCVALMERMKGGRPPWIDHEVLEDRAGLWTAHAIAHRVAPDTYTAPDLTLLTLSITPQPPAASWRRPRGRTLLAAEALASAPDPSPTFTRPTEGWAFDTLWHVDADPTDASLILRVRTPAEPPTTWAAETRWDFEP